MQIDFTSKAGQERLQKLYRYAQVGLYVNGVTHDVNNFLGAMMAYAELVSLDENLGEESQRMLNEIVSGAARCSELVNSLTDVARPERQTVSLVDVAALLKRVVMLREYAMRAAGIKVETQIQDAGTSIAADLPKLQLLFLYLLANAQEAVAHEKRKVVRIGSRNCNEGIEVCIWDSGPGVDESARAALFEPYHTMKNGYHLGCGLSNAAGYAALHGGTLGYEPDRGFVLWLPFETALESRANASKPRGVI